MTESSTDHLPVNYYRTSTRRLISELKPWPRNSRRRKTLEDLKTSLSELGQFGSIIVQAGTDRVIAGWHTTKAAEELGWEEIECDEYEVPDDVARAWNVAANKLGERGDYDLDALAASLEGMSETVAAALFTEDEREELVAGITAAAGEVPDVRPPVFDTRDGRTSSWDEYPPSRDEEPRERDNSVTPRDRTPAPEPGPVTDGTENIPVDIPPADEVELVLLLDQPAYDRATELLAELAPRLGAFTDGEVVLAALEALAAAPAPEPEVEPVREPTNEGLLLTEPSFSDE